MQRKPKNQRGEYIREEVIRGYKSKKRIYICIRKQSAEIARIEK